MKIRYKLTPEGSNKSAWDFCSLSKQILRYANMGVSRTEFIKLILKMFIDFSRCDATEFLSKEDDKYYRGVLLKNKNYTFIFEVINAVKQNNYIIPAFKNMTQEEELYSLILSEQIKKTQKFFTKNGSMWIPDTNIEISLSLIDIDNTYTQKSFNLAGRFNSMIILPFQTNNFDNGLIVLKSLKKHFFTRGETEFYETVSQTIGISISDRRAQFNLRERIKELTCLYNVNKILQNKQYSFDEILQNIADILPSAFLLPQYSSARIVLNSKEYKSKGYKESKINVKRPINIWGEERGFIEICYFFDKNPITTDIVFLKEEISLIENISLEIAKFAEQQQLEEEKQRISTQLRHADKLATIGQLSAGIAHELNEPLTIILGFAQLIKKNPILPEQIEKDIDKIINAAIYGREIIRKLLTFARQMPTKKINLNINTLLQDISQFFDIRLKKENISVKLELQQDLPHIEADQSQITQVLMNIIVNAIQAMPNGGTLTLKTQLIDNYIMVSISDTGIGMTEEVKKQIFIPFFTTKEVGKGTGLGLSVALGIIESHGGKIDFETEEGKGSTFYIKIPIKN
ncbi:MAG: ATP-binding protein [Deltaproteobacteria bacterium]|nr:ATP-binding protein [Deltaproteobacteria bacterium]